MIKRLNLFSSTAQTDLNQALIDKTHQKLKFGYMRKIYTSINSQKYLTNLLSVLKKNFKSSNYTLRIKSLIMLHYLIKKTMFQRQQIIEFAQHQLNEMKQKKNEMSKAQIIIKQKVQLQNQQKEYIQKNIIQFYIMYLLKYINHSSAYIQARQATQSKQQYFGIIQEGSPAKRCQLQTTSVTQLQRDILKVGVNSQRLLKHINNGFEILNLINFIIQSQQSFNKMGRYYIQHEQILNLFIMYLDDMTVYNNYTKKLAKLLTKSINYVCEKQIKHCFLYLTQSQKTSDRLYQFYYNRYYYSKVKRLITMPTFLTIDNHDFDRVVKQIKKVDKQLFLIVKQSKYSNQFKMNKTLGCITQPNFIGKGSPQGKINRTMMTQTGNRKLNALNKTLQDLKNHPKSTYQLQKNITRYIEQFQDIFDDDTTQYSKKFKLKKAIFKCESKKVIRKFFIKIKKFSQFFVFFCKNQKIANLKTLLSTIFYRRVTLIRIS